ncbi:restriction endonuclease subunit S [Streptomyces olivaceoviridis]|uniref:restriction endonuclease subunit S n=1 Tax=Streptomyces olivaceoviridis TaxID=1921 RepID=UPI0037B63DB4
MDGESELPAGWAWATLQDVAHWGSGGTPQAKNSAYYGGGIPWAVIGDLNDSVLRTTQQTITEDGLKNSSAKMVPEGSVLIAMYGSIGKLALPERSVATNQAIAHAVPYRDVMDRKYLFWYLRFQRPQLIRAGKGGTQQNISQTVLKAWPIAVPPLAEQHRIVEALEEQLSRLDAAEANVRKVMQRAAALLGRVTDFTSGLSIGSDDAAAPVPSDVGSIDGELPRVPADWRWMRLGELADVVGGVTKDKKKQSDPDLTEVPYLRVANVQRGHLDLEHLAKIRVPSKKAEQLRLQDGDVLMNEGGDRDKLGRGWVWRGQIPNAIHQNHVFRARIRKDLLRPELLSWYANGAAKWFEENGKQSTNLASISLSKIKKLPVPVPPQNEQKRIAERIEEHLIQLGHARVATERVLRQGKKLRNALLRKAFQGAFVPQNEADEPAAEVLARIAAERAAQPKPKRPRKATTRQSAKPPAQRAAEPAALAPQPTPAPALAVQQEFDL